ncbi:YqaA family protein [Alteromonas gilva]|uniref:VTT domain-containing protein n=1 Tax=Alteromonas gilva TaxID=2987522 RepID=A0ABT5KYC5_9ALTE|nr:VTT domain-containing protein [Alteromonas gilva]MDC8829206.1 VTT domain-containing protein [Alteromonas gilva]
MVESKHMLRGLTIASFLESTIVPIPLEAVLVPLMQAKRDKLWLLALMATVGCVIGAVFGYTIGYYLFDAIGQDLIQWFSSEKQFETIKHKMDVQGFWFVLSLGIVPVPFQIAMLAAGATQYSIGLFILATVIARSLRYFALALIVKIIGNQAEHVIKKYKVKAMIAISIVVAGLWWVLS